MAIYSGFPITWCFSIVMLVYQRVMSLPWGVYKCEHQSHGDWRYAWVSWWSLAIKLWSPSAGKPELSNNTWRLTDHQRNLTDQARNGTSRVNQHRWSSWWLVGWRGISHLKDAYFTEENNLYSHHTYWCCPIMIDSSFFSQFGFPGSHAHLSTSVQELFQKWCLGQTGHTGGSLDKTWRRWPTLIRISKVGV